MQCVLAVCVCSVQWPGACVGYIYIDSYITCMRCETAKGITLKKAEGRSLQSCSPVSIDPIWRDFDATI